MGYTLTGTDVLWQITAPFQIQTRTCGCCAARVAYLSCLIRNQTLITIYNLDTSACRWNWQFIVARRLSAAWSAYHNLRYTKCGRLVSMTALRRMMRQGTEAAECTIGNSTSSFDFGLTESALEEYIRSDETVGPYVALFFPLLNRYIGSDYDDFESLLSRMVDSWDSKQCDQFLHRFTQI